MRERPPTDAAGLPGLRGHVEAEWAAGVLTGYALLPDAALEAVEVTVNGTPAGRAEPGDRPDVATAYPAIPHAGRSGFLNSGQAAYARTIALTRKPQEMTSAA